MPTLDSLFEALKLDHLAAQCDGLLEQAAKKDLGYRELLTQALTCEWQGRKQKGAEARLAQARLPWLKTLEQFDFSFQPSIDRKVVRELSTLGFVERAENIVLLGPPGVGKTHLAIGLAIKAAQVGHRVLFLTLEQLMSKLKRASQENRLERQFAAVDVSPGAGPRRDRLPAAVAGGRQLAVPSGGAALREGLGDPDEQQELRGLG